MRIKSTLSKITLGLLGILGVVGAIIFWMTDPLNLRAPADWQLIATFHDHRAAFEGLTQLASEDITRDWRFSKSHLSEKLDPTRREQYRKLLSEIPPNVEVVVDNNRAVRFIFATGGLSAISSGWLKGIEYIPGAYAREGTISSDLDKANRLPAGVYLKAIVPNWFCVYQRTID